MVKFKEDIEWGKEQPITVDLLNFMTFNDIFIDNHFLDCKVNNVAHDGSLRDNHWIINHAAIWAREVDVTPGVWHYDEDTWPYTTGKVRFPNGIFDSKYKPIVVLTPKGNRAFPQGASLRTVDSDGFDYTFYVFADEKPSSRLTFHMDILAIGIKPVADNDLDNQTDMADGAVTID